MDIYLNEPNADQRQIAVYLLQTDGITPQTSLTGVTCLYEEPGGTDVAATLISDGAGRYRVQLAAGDVDTAGVGWLTCTGTTIIPFVEPIVIRRLQSVSLGAGAITTTTFADGAITAAKIAANAIGATQLASGAITAAKIAADAIGASQLAADAVAEILAGILAGVVYGTRTVKGILTRQDRNLIGAATSLKSTSPAIMMPDGTTPAFSTTQDTDAGTRTAASIVNGD